MKKNKQSYFDYYNLEVKYLTEILREYDQSDVLLSTSYFNGSMNMTSEVEKSINDSKKDIITLLSGFFC